MNTENENFDGLRRLLKLKRHESPPPRYFNDFSSQVISRIRAGHPVDRPGFFDTATWEAPWLQRVLAVFERKPALAGLFGAAVCGVLVGGAVYSEQMAMPGGPSDFAETALPTPVAAAVQPVAFGSAAGLAVVSSTNPVSIFDAIRTPGAQLTVGRPFGQQ